MAEKTGFASWYYVLDDTRMNLKDAPKHILGLQRIAREVEERLPGGQMNDGPIAELRRGQERKTAQTLILLGFSLPLVGLLVCFVAAISALLVRAQGQEIAMLISRGSSRSQVLGLMTIEALVVSALGLPLGTALGLTLAWLLGYSYTFLRFAVHESLQVSLLTADWRLVALGAALFLGARLGPAWAATRMNILAHERGSARWRNALGTGRRLLLLLLGVATAYAYRQLAQRGTLGLVSWLPGDPTNDPLLLLAPSLFLLTAPLAFAELLMFLVSPVAWAGKAAPTAGIYLGCMALGREGGQYRLSTYMLVLALSLGVFYGSLARSADEWLLDRRQYEVGADITFRLFPDAGELSTDSAFGPGAQSVGAREQALVAEESPALVPLSEYERIPGVMRAVRVGDYWATTQTDDPVELRLLAAERTRFAEIAYFRRDYAALSLGALMNSLGQNPQGVLLPRELAGRLHLGTGDRLRLNVAFDEQARRDSAQRYSYAFVVAGVFDYFPTMERDQGLLAVANLDYLQEASGGALPHGIWLRLAPGTSSQGVREGIQRLRVAPYHLQSLSEVLARDQRRLERVGIFGMISVCFVASALLAAVGMVVSNVTAMARRATRLAVVQALGLGRGGVLVSLAVEHLLTVVYGVAGGLGIGVLAARLYVPFFPLTEMRQTPVPPFLPQVDWPLAWGLASGVGAALVAIEGVLLWRVARMRIFEALRLGMRQ